MIVKRLLLIALLAALSAGCGNSAGESNKLFSNPIIPGFAPDPSIVRVDDDFYLVNSTFEYFPGIPIYHSRDLVNWELIGYALNDPQQVDLGRIRSSDGIHASTIRYHDGTYYIITTNNVDGNMVNFIVTAANPRGPWSAPQVLEGAPGIDPSLFFDDDGRVWYVGNHVPPDPEFAGQAEIWLQQVDIDSMRLVGERHYLWRGCCQGVWAEGPHIYKKDGYYYLLISEGGTAYEHALAVAISREITGPYLNNPRNPVLSHRQLSYDHPITGVGHADLVELEDGRWYAVALGWRLVDGIHGILGRETFLLPVTWETEPYSWKEDKLTFPVFSPATGKIELHYPLPFGGDSKPSDGEFSDKFDARTLDLQWNFRRAPEKRFYDLDDNPGSLRLVLQAGALGEREQYSFIGIRQRHFEFDAVTKMTFAPVGEEEAGLVVIQNDRSAFLMTMSAGPDGNMLKLTQALHGQSKQLDAVPYKHDAVFLRVTGDYLIYRFQYSVDGGTWTTLGGDTDGTALSPAAIAGYNYTGVYLGLYATSNGAEARNYADFEFFRYEPTEHSRDDWFERQLANEDKH
ncbi:MAG: glycoside hydrolase family 43 protein [Gammaproteobacteria bacterium]|nr:glycoside hydrolase family 43 protein [Gammaproteobacteria bacterium]